MDCWLCTTQDSERFKILRATANIGPFIFSGGNFLNVDYRQPSAMPKMHNEAHNESGLCVQYLLDKKVAVTRGHLPCVPDDQIQKEPALLFCLDCCEERAEKPFFIPGYEVQSDLCSQVSCTVSMC